MTDEILVAGDSGLTIVLEARPDNTYPGLSAWNVFAGPFKIGRISKVADKQFLVSRDAKTFETPQSALFHHLALLTGPAKS